ncbi:unnamed protein product, partial [Musa acuminata subsp. burmannicoides]
MRRHSVVSERATLLFLLALTCAVSSSLERSSPLILPSSSSCLAKLQLGVLCCFLPSLAIHIPTRPDISPPLLEQQHRFCISMIHTQHTLIGFIPRQILSERLTRFYMYNAASV